MTILFLALGGLIAATVGWMIVRTVRITLGSISALQREIEPVLAPLREGRTPSPDQIHALAARVETRSVLYRALGAMRRADLFPAHFATPEALAESDLVVWLAHGNELGAKPDAIEHVKTIERTIGASGRRARYLVFRFRTDPPHWASKSGWMAGVAGPYLDRDEGFDTPQARVFSKFEAFDARAPEDHLSAMEQVTGPPRV